MLCIGTEALAELRLHGEEGYPEEACGVLLGRSAGGKRQVTGVVRCGNEHPGPRARRYAIAPRELLRAQQLARQRGEEIVGFYHSHPDEAARWSPTDLAEAHWLGCSYLVTRVCHGRAEATTSYLLDGTGEEDKRFTDEELRVEPPAGRTEGVR